MNDSQLSEVYANARSHHKAGRLEEAKVGYSRILELVPRHDPSLQFLGLIAHQQDDHEKAVTLIEEAIRIGRPRGLYYNNYGIALKALERLDDAEAAFRKALELDADYSGALYNLAMLLFEREDLDEAEQLSRKALERKPEFIDALHGLGNIQAAKGLVVEAERTLRQSLEIDPENTNAYTHLGRIKMQFGRTEEAIELFRTAVRLDPKHDLALMHLGSAFMSVGSHDAARACFKRVVKAKPDAAGAWISLASIEDGENNYKNALAAYRYAAHVNPAYTAKVACHLALLFLKACDWNVYEAREKELIRLVEDHLEDESLEDLTPLSLNYFGIPTDLRRRAATHRAAIAEKAVEVSKKRCAFVHDTSRPDRIKVGYVSPDFRTHAVGTLIRDMFGFHDRSKFEVHAYSLVSQEDAVTTDIQNGVDHYLDVATWSAEAAARQVFADGIHILIDLAGYTTHSKTELFALQPAPVQAHYMGYLDTMGAQFLQYLIADEQVVTPDMEASFSESVIYLPGSFFVTSAMASSDRTFSRSEVGIPDDAFVFCCMNNQRKINPEVFDAWMRILARVPGAVLWLHDRDDVGGAANLRQAAATREIDPDRIIISGPESHSDYMSRYPLADLFLDTFVYSAGATAVGALWSGVPILTRPGGTMLNRMGSSLVMGVGLPELVASSTDSYVDIAVELAHDRPRVEAMKRHLRENQKELDLFNTKKWVTNFEKGLQLMWEDFETGRGPRSHHVTQ
jgi:protein O-GlcNAc transferase